MSNASSGKNVVVVHDLHKSYGDIRAVDGVSFELRRGDVMGFLGPNGAGKTTVMKIITGFLEPDSGGVQVVGHDIASEPLEARRRIGYLPENAPAYGEMTVDGFLKFVARARGLDDLDGATERAVGMTGLASVRGQSVETLSKGFKRRVGLAQALIHDPEVLILDEPTDGLDPNQKALVQELIENLAESKSIILSTHILDEAEKVCNRALIISRGQLLEDSTPQELNRRSGRHNVIAVSLGSPEEATAVRQLFADVDWCDHVESDDALSLEIFPQDGDNRLLDASRLLQSFNVSSLEQRSGSFDDVFRSITKGVAS